MGSSGARGSFPRPVSPAQPLQSEIPLVGRPLMISAAAEASSGAVACAASVGDSLRSRQAEFADAILDPDRLMPSGLIGPFGRPSARRFGVYRNNVILGLCQTLAAAFPAVRRLVGEAFFTAMAKAYVMREPPQSPMLLAYGGSFPNFIQTFEPVAGLPYLSGVARIERGRLEAYHAEEAEPLAPAVFTGLAAEGFAQARLTLHPSVRVIRSALPALSIWRTNVEDKTPVAVDAASGGEDALILRPAAEVAARLAPPGGAVFVAWLASGLTLAEATQAAAQDDPRFDLTANLVGLVAAGAIVAILIGEHGGEHVGS
jgi:Putative DNA-binding domain